ncbi:glycosyltransferase family 2 protein [Nevskia soli]|uniref:glycosyltransferase family 2 protein n=1 Tax=Nevskia soli TaxID=418856 RepID=UPI000A06A219|nr:glycosyltransferase family 2 protein [Nevskia soli]
MKQPVLSSANDVVALILNYRTPARVASCLAALESNGVKHALIWDNSADGGASAAALRASLPAAAIQVRIVESPDNLGFGTGVNRGIAEVVRWRGQVPVLLVNSDARAEPEMVKKLWRRLERENFHAVVAPMRHDQPSQALSGFMHYHRLTGLIFSRPHPGTFAYLNGCCLLIPPDLCAQPLFDEAFFFYGDDCELSWRLRRLGVVLCEEAGAEIWHEGSGSSIRGSSFYEYHIVRSHFLMAEKISTSSLERIVFLQARLVTFALRAGLRALRQRSSIPLRAYSHALCDHLAGLPAARWQPAGGKPGRG